MRVAVACTVALVGGAAPAARAGFDSSRAAGPLALSSASLSAPSGLSATCVNHVASLTWTATPSSFADGYEILRARVNGGPYTPIASVSGQATTAYNDGTMGPTGKYYYVVRATKQLWRSPNSNQVTVNASSC